MRKITEEDILHYIQKSNKGPFALRRLMAVMEINVKERRQFKSLLEKLVASGRLILIKGGKYGLPQKMDLVTGYVKAHPSGFGFVIPELEDTEDLFIPPDNMREVFDGDQVVARVDHLDREGRKSGTIVRILKRAHQMVIGCYGQTKHLSFVTPNNPFLTQDIIIPKNSKPKPEKGQLVVVEILEYPTKHRNPTGRIAEILGRPDDPNMDMEIVIRDNQLPAEFPEQAVTEAKACLTMSLAEAELGHRLDLRNLLTFTIDGERARDFDDAISLELLPSERWRLWVHIADVGHYVKENSGLDQEAFFRGTSIYFPDRAIPMLPEELSSDLCSLKAGVDRLTISVRMDFDNQGCLLEHSLAPSIIKSNERMTYTEVFTLLTKGSTDLPQYEYLLTTVETMAQLASLLRKKRFKGGSLDFDLDEPEVILDSRGDVLSIIRAERNCAHQLIEEFMLAANRVVAEYLTGEKIPSLYRIHEEPEEAELLSFLEFIHSLGWQRLDPEPAKKKRETKLEHADIREILEFFRGRPEEGVVNFLLLRTMKQARYATHNVGHYGLAIDQYTHFTSPIRRYPDLVVHRLLKRALAGEVVSMREDQALMEKLTVMANHSSFRERIAQEAERKIVAIKRARYMQEKIGEEYVGMVSGVTSFGLFVELEEIFVEGLVHLRTMGDDYYQFDEHKHCLEGSRTKRVFHIGDRVKVKVAHVDLAKIHIDFTMMTKFD